MASALANGSMNGSSGIAVPKSQRFSDIPSTIDIPVQDQDDEAVEIDLEELADDPGELCTLFEMEHAARTYWMTVALAYAKQKKVDFAIEMLMRGANAMQSNQREKLSMITCLCWMYLWKSRDAPRVAPEGSSAGEAKTKEYYLQLATQSLNDASRINPAFPPLFLARGVLILLKASLQPPSKTPGAVDTDKMEQVRNALKSFEEAIRVSQGKNMLAVMGKARALFSLGKHAESLAAYQEVLAKMPTLVDPDPRIGIGCCFWQLGFKDDAKLAWERCLEINPENKYANILLGLYHLDLSGHIPANSQDFVRLYKKAIAEYTQKSYKLDRNLPLTCATFAKYFLPRKEFSNVEILATKAINYTDVNAIASDGWYLLARKEHASGDLERANDYYRRADDSRGGSERGYLPAKFGAAQLAVLKNDLGEAKLRLEKMIQQSKNVEAQVLLGTLYAEEAFANHSAPIKEDKTAESKKAITLLDQVRNAWKDPKKNITPDPAVLLNLARLYETENPERSLQCLKEVEQMELDQIPKSEYPPDTEDEAAIRSTIRKLLPPQLLNNVACFYSQEGKHQLATEFFQAALDSCARISQADSEVDTDALLTTISFNLGRSYEHEGLVERAVETYEQLLNRHSDYTDAQVRLTYIKLRKNPNKEGPEAVDKLQKEKGADLEVRALYGWYLGKVNMKRKSGKLEEDPEYRFYKHTLQDYDKHDRYALVAMGNLQLMAAREMRRDTDADRQKRSHAYSRAVEFFEKVLSLDPKNAYAAQGVGIALAEDKKDFKNALQIFLKVRETLQDPHVFVNLGHVYCEVKQYSKAIENYEIALSKEGKANDPVILSCLGRTWLHKGRAEKNFDAYKTALEYAQKALKVSPEQPHFKFNVAFVQIQLASTIVAQRESERNSFQLEEAIEGLEAAIKALDEIAAAPNPPYPKHDIESRANMARNTQRNHLQKALAAQKEYEAKNKEKQAAALAQRQEAIRKKEELRKKEEEAERERQDKIRRERETIAARDRELAAQRAEEEKQRMEMEMTTDSETGEKVKKKKRPAPGSSQREGRGDREGSARPRKGRATKKKGGSRRDRGGDDGESDGGDAGARGERPKKKARLSSRKEAAASSNKYKSAEIVVDSDDSEGDYGAGGEQEEDALDRAERALAMRSGTRSKSLAGSDDEDDEDQGGRSRRRRNRRDSSGTDGGDNADRMDVDDERERGTGEGDYRAGAGGGGGGDDDDEDEDETVTRRAQAKRGARRGRVVESDDEDEDEEAVGGGGGEPQEKADTSMVDAPDDDE